jgi:Mg2+/Co2+ transporter CorB
MENVMFRKKHLYQEKVKKDNRVKHLDKDKIWILQITLMAFVLSLALSFISDTIIPNVPILVSILVLVVFILLGILFDMIGVSVTVADKKVFNSMASKKVKGAKTALLLIKNSSKVSSFCNDVVGDICGILSGGAGITVALSLANYYGANEILINLVVTSLIAALTIGGKALGKSHAINKANSILYKFSKLIDTVTLKK